MWVVNDKGRAVGPPLVLCYTPGNRAAPGKVSRGLSRNKNAGSIIRIAATIDPTQRRALAVTWDAQHLKV